MREYSQTYGSFTRTGDYPLEANYIFQTEQELIDFYQDREDNLESTTLHQGLLKVVGEGDNQALYWVVKDEEGLHFKKLIENVDRETIYEQLGDLYTKLQEEISNREEADSEIWGDKDNVLEDLNSIKKISDVIDVERKKLEKLHREFNATVGVTDRDIIEYLKTLPYQSLTEVISTLDNFLNKTNPEDSTIDTLVELKNFLQGFNDTDILMNILTELYHRIEGSPLPSEGLRTLRGLEDALTLLGQLSKNRIDNLQTELDATQTGVGLNQDGTFSPDQSTNFLKNATSIVSALRELDRLLKVALEDCNISTEDTDTIQLDISKNESGTVLSGHVKLSPLPNNQIINSEGLYNYTELEYSQGILTLKINENIISVLPLGISAIVNDGYYDSTNESLVIKFALHDGSEQVVRIPVGALIREWTIDNSIPGKVVELTREEVIGEGPDKLSADVRISTQPDNILQKSGNSLYVSKNNILAEVQSKLDSLKDQLTLLINTSVETERNRAEIAEDSISNALQSEITRAIAAEESIRALLNSLNLSTVVSKIEDLTERVKNLEIKTSW